MIPTELDDTDWRLAIAPRITAVEQRLVDACVRARRARQDVRLIAVSKRQPTAAIRAAKSLGLTEFGENYMQELLDKCVQLQDLPGVRMHAIGHLQRNKVRSLVKAAKLSPGLCLHTVDSEPLIAELQKRAASEDIVLEVFVEVNVAREAQKSGCLPEQLPRLVQTLTAAPNLKLQGLMAIPPFSSDPEFSRPYFKSLRTLRDANCSFAPRLSMGMSHDVEVAIEEGATDVRVGTAIFGPRSR